MKRLAIVFTATLVLFLILCLVPAALANSYEVSMGPMVEANVIGEEHTVTVTIEPAPAEAEVYFEIVFGPNVGDNITIITYDGEASFTYTGDGNSGVDIIEAAVNVSGTYYYPDEVYKFWLIDKFSGGGKIIQEGEGKSKTWPKITWGGWAGTADLGGWIELGAFEVTFHNVSENDLDKAKFVSEDQELGITELNWLIYGDQSSCPDAYPPESEANFVWLNVPGSLELEDGTVLEDCMLGIRASDNGEPGNIDDPEGDVATDSIAFALWYDGDLIYESWLWGDFDADQDDCFSIRHELDSGNLQIVVLPD